MTIKIKQAQDETQTILICIHGRLDASNFQELINATKQVIDDGAQILIFDLSKMKFLSSSGLFALYNIGLLMCGETPLDQGLGWEAFHSIDRDRVNRIQANIKLYNLQPNVEHTLEVSGFDDYFEIHTGLVPSIESINNSLS